MKTAIGAFPGDAEQVGRTRRFITGVLGEDWPRLDDVLLLASEVASNAVRHTASGDGGQFDVSVSVLAAGLCVRVAVTDQGGASEPVMPSTGSEADGVLTGGRGLHIVDVVADRWGHRGDELGRVVWFEVTAKPDDLSARRERRGHRGTWRYGA